MTYKVKIYTDEDEIIYSAKDTDQAGTSQTERTVHGDVPVEFVGEFYPSQFRYRPFKQAVVDAAQRLRDLINEEGK